MMNILQRFLVWVVNAPIPVLKSVHVVRAPVDAIVVKVIYKRSQYRGTGINAEDERAAHENVRTVVPQAEAFVNLNVNVANPRCQIYKTSRQNRTFIR